MHAPDVLVQSSFGTRRKVTHLTLVILDSVVYGLYVIHHVHPTT